MNVAAGHFPARAVEELGHHREPESVLVARSRQQQRTPRVGRELDFGAEGRAQFLKQVLQATQPNRHFSEVAQIFEPQIAQVLGGWRQQVEVDHLDRHALAADLGDALGHRNIVGREHQADELLHLVLGRRRALADHRQQAIGHQSVRLQQARNDLGLKGLDEVRHALLDRLAGVANVGPGGRVAVERKPLRFLPFIRRHTILRQAVLPGRFQRQSGHGSSPRLPRRRGRPFNRGSDPQVVRPARRLDAIFGGMNPEGFRGRTARETGCKISVTHANATVDSGFPRRCERARFEAAHLKRRRSQ